MKFSAVSEIGGRIFESMESDPKSARSGKGIDYIDVEVLPSEGKTTKPGDLDPFIKLVSRLLDTFS